jgi:hypothetical protein
MPGGAINDVNIRVAGAVPFLVMKGMALWTREERKDAYDIYYLVSNYPGGIDGLAKAFEPYQKHVMVREGLSKIRSKFLNPEYIGPVWAAEFQAVQDPERNEQIKRDAFEKISRFLDRLGIEQYKGI